MLDFKREKVSNQLAAHSETVPFKVYWVDNSGAWTYLTVTAANKRGPGARNAGVYDTIEEAKEAAQAMEVADNEDL